MTHYPPPLARQSAPPPQIARSSAGSATAEGESSRLARTSVKSDLTRESLRAYLEKRSPGLERPSVNRAALELARRSDYPLNCTLNLSLSPAETGSNVYFKYDGSRFRHADATVKVMTGTSYRVSLTTKPGMEIAQNLLLVRAVTPSGAVREEAISIEKSRTDGRTWSGSWKCEWETSPKNERVDVTLSGQLRDFGEFSVPLLMKVYPTGQKRAHLGFKLRLVVFELRRQGEGTSGAVKLDSVRGMTHVELNVPNAKRAKPRRNAPPAASAVVIDNGSHELRAGFSAEPDPCLVFPNQLIRPRARWSTEFETVVGESHFNVKEFDFGRAAVRNPFDGNVVVNFDTQEAILDYVFDRLGFKEALEETGVVMTECFLNPLYARNTMMELMFEAYGVANLTFVPDGLAAFHHSQRTGRCSADTMLLCSGHSATHVVPIIDNYAHLHHAQRSKICGSLATTHLHQLLSLHNAHCAAGLSRQLVQLMKEQCTLCSHDYLSDLDKIGSDPESSGGLGVKIQLPKAPSSTIPQERPVEKEVDRATRAEEQRHRLKLMSMKRKEKMISEKEELLNYLTDIHQQVLETDSEDVMAELLEEAEVGSLEELQSYTLNVQTSLKKLKQPPEPPKPQAAASETPAEGTLDVADLKEQYRLVSERLAQRKRSRSGDGGAGGPSRRVSSAQRRRMKLVAEAAAQDDSDDFGADDKDWEVYKEMDPHSSLDQDLNRQDEAELKEIKAKLQQMGEEIEEMTPSVELGYSQLMGQLDEQHVYLSVERLRIPELLFQPSLMGIDQAGIPEIVARVLKNLPDELSARVDREMLLCGGNAAYRGLQTRLETEMCSLRPLGRPMRVLTPQSYFLDAWRGAAGLAESPTVVQFATTRAEYEEMGQERLQSKPIPFVHYL